MGLLLALLGGQAVTGAVETQQAAQTINAAGGEVFTGTVTLTQGAQDAESTAKLVFESAGESTQAVQNSVAFGQQTVFVPPVRWRPPIAAMPLAIDGRAASIQPPQECEGKGALIPAVTGEAVTASRVRQFRAIGSIDNARPINRRLAIAIALAEAA